MSDPDDNDPTVPLVDGVLVNEGVVDPTTETVKGKVGSEAEEPDEEPSTAQDQGSADPE